MYPFLFWKVKTDAQGCPTGGGRENFHVIIASHIDYVGYDSSWMNNELGDLCFIPDVDLSQSHHRFDTEDEAIQFIRQWWRNN